MKSNIKSIVKRRLCLGCGTCEGVCPKDAVMMRYSVRNGTYTPLVDDVKCDDCGLCLLVCPGREIDMAGLSNRYTSAPNQSKRIGRWSRCFVGYSLDPEIRFKASSGGIVPSLLIHMLSSGDIDIAVAVRMKNSSPLDTEPFFIRNRFDVIQSIGSKYCPAATNTIFRQLNREEKKMGFVGLPCHIAGLRKAQDKKPLSLLDNVYVLGIFCGGMRAQEATQWILKSNNIPLHALSKIQYRGDGWPGTMRIFLKNGEEISIPYPDYCDQQYSSWQPRRCSLCIDGTAELADISVGDAWLPEYKEEKYGISIIITRNDKGLGLIREASKAGAIYVEEIDVQTVLRSQQPLLKDKKDDVRNRFQFVEMIRRKRPEYYDEGMLPDESKMLHTVKTTLRAYIFRKSSRSRLIYQLLKIPSLAKKILK